MNLRALLFALPLVAIYQCGLCAAPVSGDVTYAVISDKENQHFKRNIDVRLNKKVSEDVLRTIAMELKNKKKQHFDRTFIFYYLPDQTVGSGAWATTHFDPALEVAILGLTESDERKLASELNSEGRNVVGVWVDESPYAGSVITLFRKDNTLHLARRFTDGSGFETKMIEDKVKGGTKLVEVGGNPHDEYYFLDNSGDLHAGGENGLFKKFKKK